VRRDLELKQQKLDETSQPDWSGWQILVKCIR